MTGGIPADTGPEASALTRDRRGAIYVEQVVLVALVAVGCAAAAVPLLALLVGYHRGVELVLALPVP